MTLERMVRGGTTWQAVLAGGVLLLGVGCSCAGLLSPDLAIVLVSGGFLSLGIGTLWMIYVGVRITRGTGPLFAHLTSKGIDPAQVDQELLGATRFSGVWLTDRWLVTDKSGVHVMPYREIAFVHGTGDGLVVHRYGEPAVSIGSQGDDFLAALRRHKPDLLFGNNASKLSKIALERIGR